MLLCFLSTDIATDGLRKDSWESQSGSELFADTWEREAFSLHLHSSSFSFTPFSSSRSVTPSPICSHSSVTGHSGWGYSSQGGEERKDTGAPVQGRPYTTIHLLCASLVAQLVKNPPAMWETWVRSLGWEDPLEKGKVTHSSILAWRIPWTSMGSRRVGHNRVTPV